MPDLKLTPTQIDFLRFVSSDARHAFSRQVTMRPAAKLESLGLIHVWGHARARMCALTEAGRAYAAQHFSRTPEQLDAAEAAARQEVLASRVFYKGDATFKHLVAVLAHDYGPDESEAMRDARAYVARMEDPTQRV